MSEIREYDMDKNGRLLQQPDPTTASIDALRQAVVAQTALLRSLSEQVRISYEGLDEKLNAIGNEQQINATSAGERYIQTLGLLEGLAERLEKLERDNLVIASRLLSIEGKLPASEIRTTLAHKQILLKDLQPKRAAARRKTKR